MPSISFSFVSPDGNSTSLSNSWVPSPNTRGTIDIIWSCLTTLFICLWVQLHLNVPAPDEGFFATSLRKSRWLICGLLVPEFLLLASAGQWSSARRALHDFDELNYGHRWSRTHGFFADSGGFVLVPPDCSPFPVTSRQIHYLVKEKHLEMPDIPVHDIVDKSKGDKFTKTVACLQTLWFITQAIARVVQRLPVAPIELQTCNIILCTMTTYLFWLSKPLDVGTPIRIPMATRITDVLISGGNAASTPYRQTPLEFAEPDAYILAGIPQLSHITGVYRAPFQRLPNDRNPHLYSLWLRAGLGAIVIVFSTLSFSEWHFHFPSHLEKLLWRISCITAQVSLFIHACSEAVANRKQLHIHADFPYISGYKLSWPTGVLLFWSPFVTYVIARLLILALAIAVLRDLPLGCYITVNWTGFMPHLK